MAPNRTEYRALTRLSVMAALLIVTVSLDAAGASSPLERVRPSDCVGSYNAKDGMTRLLINNCDRVAYVSVLELDPTSVRPRCAVFGLQGRRYGKAYGPGESYMAYSLSVSFDADKALNACERSGYEIHGGGVGRFIVVTDFDDD